MILKSLSTVMVTITVCFYGQIIKGFWKNKKQYIDIIIFTNHIIYIIIH